MNIKSLVMKAKAKSKGSAYDRALKAKKDVKYFKAKNREAHESIKREGHDFDKV